MERRIEVGILGGTGMVGQHFVRFLQNHPWFVVTWLGASDRSAGKKYREAAQWHLGGETPASVADIVVEECKPGNAPKLVFSATDAAWPPRSSRPSPRRATWWSPTRATTAWRPTCRCWCRRLMRIT